MISNLKTQDYTPFSTLVDPLYDVKTRRALHFGGSDSEGGGFFWRATMLGTSFAGFTLYDLSLAFSP